MCNLQLDAFLAVRQYLALRPERRVSGVPESSDDQYVQLWNTRLDQGPLLQCQESVLEQVTFRLFHHT